MRRFVKKRAERPAAAAVEFAVILPLVVALLLGAVELGRAVTVQHMLQEAAQAGCRLYSVNDPELTRQDAIDIIELAMSHAGVDNYEIDLEPGSRAEVDEHLEPVTVRITVAYNDVSWFTPKFLADANIVGTCTLPADVDQATSDDGGGGDSKKDPKKVSKKDSKKSGGKKHSKKSGGKKS